MENNTLKAQLGANIAELRTRAGVSKTTFALMVGVSRPYLAAIERGTANPTVDVLKRIADGLGASVGELFGERRG
ncbi:XRE family transcriptional regulator [Gordonibacter sp. 28C]|uniref:helix-turn-helix domain-containing protein n=1 Tax=Gordonibacter sp. 28C TaxID=2078569 RepID=UPI000DF72915|nr:helix-turn-helix transcriptional regulator [Gordonibacter sp. 28C]RDB63322.1 XRE family transcriptional regulator [Gordonibacter sp. 28C]